ncbi:hypothetical protein [Methylotenera versatilis]|nr:hypothetical protein [Methylotenera versatilis]
MMKLKFQHMLLSLMIASFFIGFVYPDMANAASKQDKSAKRTALMIQKIKQDAELEKTNMQAQFDMQKKKLEEELASKDEQLIKTEKSMATTERKLKSLESDIAKVKAEKTALDSKQLETQTQLESTQKILADLNAQYKQAQADLKFNDNQRKTQSTHLAETTKLLDACEIKNTKLHQFGTELIKIYDKPDSYEAVMRKESFFQLKRVELENILQAQQDKLDDEKVVSRKPAY